MDDETRAALAGLGTQIAQAVSVLRGEMATMRDDLRGEIATSAAETRRHFDVVAEALRADVQALAEGVAANTERIEGVRTELRDEMDDRFALVHVVLADMRRDIAELRARP